MLDYKPCGSTVSDCIAMLLKDVKDEFERLTGTKLTDLTCEHNPRTHGWNLRRENGKNYELPYRAYYISDPLDYQTMITAAARSLITGYDIAGAQSIESKKITKKEKKQMKQDCTLAEAMYQSKVDAIQDETKCKKKALDAEEQEKLAKAYMDLELESMLEHVDKWAEELFARYEALHRKGFADDLAIEILKIYISNH